MLVETAGAVYTGDAGGKSTAEDEVGSMRRRHAAASPQRDWAMDIRIITEHDVEEFIRLRLEA
jgi:hypothetical protein